MSLLFKMLSRFFIAFLPRSKRLNFMAADIVCIDFGAQENEIWHCFHFSPIYLPWRDRTGCHHLHFFECRALSQLFHSPLRHYFFLLLLLLFLNWSIIALQCCVCFFCTTMWNICRYIYPFLRESPSPHSPQPSHLGHHRALSWAPCAIH